MLLSHVATLVCPPDRPVLTDAMVEAAARLLPAPDAPAWLDRGIAADIPFASAEAPDNRVLADRLREALGAPVDVVVQPAAGRRKRLFLADMDSTMIGQECIDELADLVGLKAHVAAITERAMRGEIAFEPALRERVALLKGLAAGVVEDVIASRITLTPGGRELVGTMRANGAYTALVSGGFDIFAAPIAAMPGFDESHANRLIERNGRFTGEVAEPILGRSAKAEALHAISARLGLTPDDAIAVGDGANDLDMIRLAGTGVALHAKPSVAAEAKIRIDHGDLTALLYLQGYRQEEFSH